MRIFVIIPTVGRAECVADTVARLAHQTRRPDGVLVIGAEPSDIEGVGPSPGLSVETMLARKGSSSQRNHGLDQIEDHADVALFFDDDYLPAPDYVERLERLFEQQDDLVGLTGRMVCDGVHGPGLSFNRAEQCLVDDTAVAVPMLQPRRGLYGCNMGIRLAAARGVRFDERLPLYGWQEDIDYSYRIGACGRLALAEELRGVHLGIKRGRTSGKRFGYSQIANPVYLLGKRTIPRDRAYRIMWRNVAMNLIRSIRPEAHIDRRGRLAGNMIALRDLLLGYLRPERTLEL